ncbi:unnamed protein product [Scytosiphon promiscuus]
MRRNWCRRVFDVICPCFRRRSLASSALSGALHKQDVGLNFILHGECNVGKTSLRNRWVDGIFTGDVAPTFGVDFNIKTLDLVEEVEEDEGADLDEGMGGNGEDNNSEDRQSEVRKSGNATKQATCADLQVKINVYDTSGKPGYREVNSTYLLAFDAVLFVYDISSRSSLDELRRYFSNPEHRDRLAAKREAGMAMLLVGNKCDLPLSEREQVGSQTGQDMAAEFGMPFVEVSAKTGANVREAFMFVTTRAVGEYLARARLRQATGVTGRPLVKRTMQQVPGLQRALLARASVLDVFKGIRGRRHYVQTHKAGVVVEPPAKKTHGFSGSGGSTDAGKRADEGRGQSEGRKGSDQSGRKKAGAVPAAFRGSSRHLYSSGGDPALPRTGATASHGVRDPRFPEARIGAGLTPTASLLERPEVSPMERPVAMYDVLRHRNAAPLALGCSSLLSVIQAENERPARGLSASSSNAWYTTGGQSSAARSSPQRCSHHADPSNETPRPSRRPLREASSFWLDKWGIKAAKTDATRGRHSRIKGGTNLP